MKINRKKKAFTLIEMTIVLFVISLLILIIIPNLTNQRKNAETIHTGAMTSIVQSQIDAYLNVHPSDIDVTYAALQKEGYLTKKQVQKAKSEGIRIRGNEAK